VLGPQGPQINVTVINTTCGIFFCAERSSSNFFISQNKEISLIVVREVAPHYFVDMMRRLV
jgi:hypothetical protein